MCHNTFYCPPEGGYVHLGLDLAAGEDITGLAIYEKMKERSKFPYTPERYRLLIAGRMNGKTFIQSEMVKRFLKDQEIADAATTTYKNPWPNGAPPGLNACEVDEYLREHGHLPGEEDDEI